MKLIIKNIIVLLMSIAFLTSCSTDTENISHDETEDVSCSCGSLQDSNSISRTEAFERITALYYDNKEDFETVKEYLIRYHEPNVPIDMSSTQDLDNYFSNSAEARDSVNRLKNHVRYIGYGVTDDRGACVNFVGFSLEGHIDGLLTLQWQEKGKYQSGENFVLENGWYINHFTNFV